MAMSEATVAYCSVIREISWLENTILVVAQAHVVKLQESEYSDYKPENGENHMHSRTARLEVEDGELSWFNAGVRVGVGIGLSICVGVGIGVGLLVRTYQGTGRNLRRRLL